MSILVKLLQKHQYDSSLFYYFSAGLAVRDTQYMNAGPGNPGAAALPFLLRLPSDLVCAWTDGWLASVCASRGLSSCDDLIAIFPPAVLSRQKA